MVVVGLGAAKAAAVGWAEPLVAMEVPVAMAADTRS